MNILIRIIYVFIGREVKLDKDIPIKYILKLCMEYINMFLRGFIFRYFLGSCGSKLFVGKNTKLILKNKIHFGNNVRIGHNVKINALSKEGVKLGDNVRIGDNTIIECTGSIAKIGKGIKIGNRTAFGENCYFGAAGGIAIGDDVIAGQNIRFHSENHKYDRIDILIRDQGVTNKGIRVGNNCWIGAGAVFLDGVTIGDGCVIAANAVVTKSFPDNTIIGGVPAKLIKVRVQ